MKTGCIWLAVSSEDQIENMSLENQLRLGVEHARRHGVQVVSALVVPGKTRHIVLFDRAASTVKGHRLDARDIERCTTTPLLDILQEKPVVYPYAELLTILEAARPNTMVFFFLNRSRLGRTAALSMAVIGLCRENRVKAYDLESPPTTLDITNSRDEAYVGAFKSTEAENQIWAIQENHREGMIRRVEHGKMPGKINFGYSPVYGTKPAKGRDKTQAVEVTGYTVDEEAAATIRMIVSLYLDSGFGAANIADHLNRQGRPAPAGGMWGHPQITFLLRRIWRYAGYAELNVNSATGRPYVRAKGIWPAIISEEDARRVLAEREARNPTRRSVHTVYRFTRMVVCGVCGSRLHAQTKTRDWERLDGSMGFSSHVSYRCPGDHIRIGEKKILKALSAYLTQLEDEAFREGFLRAEPADRSAEIQAQIDACDAQVSKHRAGIAKADNDHYMRQILDEERHQAIVSALKRQIVEIQAELTRLHDALSEQTQVGQREQRLDDLRINLSSWLTDEDVRAANARLRMFLQVIVEKRQVTGIVLLI